MRGRQVDLYNYIHCKEYFNCHVIEKKMSRLHHFGLLVTVIKLHHN